eukprot:gb/GECH01003239.1/.p1 GENE.gb/GECH01003239.1/~~gb/GECH01003239.1/.p1  ORF type:complete len:360 (+),score=49.18 gb/GECH01003239.1/:1-1080(+)
MQLLPGMQYQGTSNRSWTSSSFRRALFASVFFVGIVMFYVLTRSVSWPKPSMGSGVSESQREYTFAVIADKDKDSKISEKKWKSTLLNGKLVRDNDGRYSVNWVSSTELTSGLNERQRGMELSELVSHKGRLYTMDDRTGIVFEIDTSRHAVYPRHILADGDGNQAKGFKCEWATMHGDTMYVGSMGKEFTSPDGKEIVSYGPMYIKRINLKTGKLEHVDWRAVYNRLRQATGTLFPGYLIHEAVHYSPELDLWIFAPRRLSKDPYDEDEDTRRGSNTVLLVSGNLKKVKVTHVGKHMATHGFSSIKAVPGRPKEFIALRSEETSENLQTFITVFTIEGEVLMEEQLVEQDKFEGLAFL